MSTPTNIPETPMGETEQDSFSKSKEKFQQKLQDIFQTILKLTGPDHFHQLCQWMEYKQYLTIDEFYESSYNDPDKFDTKGPATEYKWKGKMNHLSPIVVQKLKCFVKCVENSSSPLILASCPQGILNSSRLSFYLLLRLLVYMYLSQLMRTFTNYLRCIVISS